MLLRSRIGLSVLLCVSFAPVLPLQVHAQDSQPARGRKYKAPPETAHIEVEILKDTNGKPIPNAAVIFHPQADGKDEGNLEVKTDPDGKVTIDVIPLGSTVTVQVLAPGYATFAKDYAINDAQKQISIRMLRPRAQVSTYVDNSGKTAQVQPGIQEPAHPAPPPASGTPKASISASSPTSGTAPPSSTGH
jgi:Carboxypeptidase regulatory-like domain